MNYIKKYQSYKEYKVNEEFIDKLVNGPLSNLFKSFSAPFKDLGDDIKKYFKDNDPGSIKNIIISNLNQAIDGAQKAIRNLKPSIPGKDRPNDPKDGDIGYIVDGFITSLTNLANNIGKDFSGSIPNKKQASAANEVAKAILLGNHEAGWEGIIKLLSDPNYKYSKQNYNSIILKSSIKKTGINAFKSKQNAAFVFFDEFQKDITSQIAKNFTEEEMKKVYDDTISKSGISTGKFNYDELINFKNRKAKVKFKLKGYDDSKPPQIQEDKIGEKRIHDIDKKNSIVIFNNDGNNTKIQKKYSDILGLADDQEYVNNSNSINKQVTNNLKELSKDPKNIEVVKNITNAIKNDPSVISKINNILPNK